MYFHASTPRALVWCAPLPSLTWPPSWWRSWWRKHWKPSRSAAVWTSPSCRADTVCPSVHTHTHKKDPAVPSVCHMLLHKSRATSLPAARLGSERRTAAACLHNPTILNQGHQALCCGMDFFFVCVAVTSTSAGSVVGAGVVQPDCITQPVSAWWRICFVTFFLCIYFRIPELVCLWELMQRTDSSVLAVGLALGDRMMLFIVVLSTWRMHHQVTRVNWNECLFSSYLWCILIMHAINYSKDTVIQPSSILNVTLVLPGSSGFLRMKCVSMLWWCLPLMKRCKIYHLPSIVTSLSPI